MKTNHTYCYRAMDHAGTIIKGHLMATDHRAAQAQLHAQGLLSLRIDKKDGFLWKNLFRKSQSGYRTSRGWSTQPLIFFTQQLSHLMVSGTPLDEALACIAHSHQQQTAQSLGEHVMEGKSLHEAMALFPKHFPKPYRAIVAAGEQSGDLGNVLQHLQAHYEDKQQFKQQMVQALLYPVTIALVGGFTTLFLILHVVPTMLSMVEIAQQQLPFATTLLLHVSHWGSQYGLFVILTLLLCLSLIITLYKKNRAIQIRCDAFLLSCPVIGQYFLKINLILYLKTLSISLKAGNALLPSLTLSNDTFTLVPLKKTFLDSQKKIREGYSIHQAWKELWYFSETNLQLLASGEQSGHLIETLDNIAQWEYKQLQRRLKYFITLFEPLVVVCIGAIVLWLVMAILLPIFNLEPMNVG